MAYSSIIAGAKAAGATIAPILESIVALASNGLIVRTSSTTVAARTLTGTANRISINNGSSATVTSGVQSNLTLRLTIGDSYLAALNNALVWTDLSAPDLTTASSITLYIGDALTKAGTALTASSVRVELTSAETETLKELQYPYSLRAVYANPGVVTPVVRSIAIVTAPQPGA
jgi:hypothetical protein